MSGISMIGVTGFAPFGQLVANTEATHTRLNNLINQASTGLIANNYAGLGSGATVSLNLRPQLANLQVWQSNIDTATGRMSVAQSALTQIQSIASSFYAQLNNLQGVNAAAVDTIAASARDALRQVAGLLDTQDGGAYVFAGQDTGNPPVPDPDNIADATADANIPYITPGSGSFAASSKTFTIDAMTGNPQEDGSSIPLPGNLRAASLVYYGGTVYGQDSSSRWHSWDDTTGVWSTAASAPPTPSFFDRINTFVQNLGDPDTAANVAKNTLGVASFSGIMGPPSPFSGYLSTTAAPALPTVQIGQNETEPAGISASANGLIPTGVSTGPAIPGGPPTTTGSYMRDVLRALATIGSLTSAQASNTAISSDFKNLVQDTRISLSNAVTAMAQDAGVLGNVQASLTATQSRLADTQTAMTSQVSSAEEVDMAATLSQLSLVQTQMQASYQLIATLNGLSLAKFLPAT